MRTFTARTRRQWRCWLAQHHAAQSEVWLVFKKRHTGQPPVSYEDAAEEALCFGWIDSVIKRLDDERYARKFTPRKANSKWSTANRHRYARLEAGGFLAPAGLKCAPTARSGDAPCLPKAVPPYIERALRANPGAWDCFSFGSLRPGGALDRRGAQTSGKPACRGPGLRAKCWSLRPGVICWRSTAGQRTWGDGETAAAESVC